MSACTDRLRLLTTHDHGDVHVETYGLELPPIFLQKIRLGPASGGLRLVSAAEAQYITTDLPAHKAFGVPSRMFDASLQYLGKCTAMFPDEREAVQKALGATPQ